MSGQTPRYYVQYLGWWEQTCYAVMSRAKRGGDRMVARCWSETSARKVAKALNRAESGQ